MSTAEWISAGFWAASIFAIAIGVFFAYRVLVALHFFDAEERHPAISVMTWLAMGVLLALPWRDVIGKLLSLVYFRMSAGGNWAPFRSTWGVVPIWFYTLLDLGMFVVAVGAVLGLGWNRLRLSSALVDMEEDEGGEGDAAAEGDEEDVLKPVDRGVLLVGVGYLVYLLWSQMTQLTMNVPFVKANAYAGDVNYLGFMAGWAVGTLIFLVLAYLMYRDISAV